MEAWPQTQHLALRTSSHRNHSRQHTSGEGHFEGPERGRLGAVGHPQVGSVECDRCAVAERHQAIVCARSNSPGHHRQRSRPAVSEATHRRRRRWCRRRSLCRWDRRRGNPCRPSTLGCGSTCATEPASAAVRPAEQCGHKTAVVGQAAQQAPVGRPLWDVATQGLVFWSLGAHGME